MLRFVIVLQFFTFALSAGQIAVDETNPIVFRFDSRLITVEVLAEDMQGHRVTDLTDKDFALLDNGKPQTLKFFDTRNPKPVPGVQSNAIGHEQIFSNLPEYEKPPSFNIVLIDDLNTSVTDQIRARAQLSTALNRLKSNSPIALMVLDSKLSVAHGLTTNPLALADTVKSLPTYISPLLVLTSEKDQQAAEAESKTIQREMINRPHSTDSPIGIELNDKVPFSKDLSHSLEMRAGWTLNAMKLLATSLASLQGRKNIFWISSAFPIDLMSESTDDPLLKNHNYASMLRSTAAQLAAADVAIYPIGLEGQITTGQMLETTGKLEFQDLQSRQVWQLWSAHETMNELASETGGQAIYGTNDFSNTLVKTLADGEAYYSLAYVPAAKQWDGKYHRLEVKVSRPHVKLTFRKGYFAITSKTPSTDGDGTLIRALDPSANDPFRMGLLVLVTPPDTPNGPIFITYRIKASDLVALGDQGARTIKVDVIAILSDSQGKEEARDADTVTVLLRGDEYGRALTNGVEVRRQLAPVPAGTYSVSTAVIDRISRKIGRVNFPLTIR